MAFKRPTAAEQHQPHHQIYSQCITIYDESLYFIYGNLFGWNGFQSHENLNAIAKFPYNRFFGGGWSFSIHLYLSIFLCGKSFDRNFIFIFAAQLNLWPSDSEKNVWCLVFIITLQCSCSSKVLILIAENFLLHMKWFLKFFLKWYFNRELIHENVCNETTIVAYSYI